MDLVTDSMELYGGQFWSCVVCRQKMDGRLHRPKVSEAVKAFQLQKSHCLPSCVESGSSSVLLLNVCGLRVLAVFHQTCTLARAYCGCDLESQLGDVQSPLCTKRLLWPRTVPPDTAAAFDRPHHQIEAVNFCTPRFYSTFLHKSSADVLGDRQESAMSRGWYCAYRHEGVLQVGQLGQ